MQNDVPKQIARLRESLGKFVELTKLPVPVNFFTTFVLSLNSTAANDALVKNPALMLGTDHDAQEALETACFSALIDEAIKNIETVLKNETDALQIGNQLHSIAHAKARQLRLASDLYSGKLGTTSHSSINDFTSEIGRYQLNMIPFCKERWKTFLRISEQL